MSDLTFYWYEDHLMSSPTTAHTKRALVWEGPDGSWQLYGWHQGQKFAFPANWLVIGYRAAQQG